MTAFNTRHLLPQHPLEALVRTAATGLQIRPAAPYAWPPRHPVEMALLLSRAHPRRG